MEVEWKKVNCGLSAALELPVVVETTLFVLWVFGINFPFISGHVGGGPSWLGRARCLIRSVCKVSLVITLSFMWFNARRVAWIRWPGFGPHASVYSFSFRTGLAFRACTWACYPNVVSPRPAMLIVVWHSFAPLRGLFEWYRNLSGMITTKRIDGVGDNRLNIEGGWILKVDPVSHYSPLRFGVPCGVDWDALSSLGWE